MGYPTYNDPAENTQRQQDTVPNDYTQADDYAEYQQWKNEGRPTTMIDARDARTGDVESDGKEPTESAEKSVTSRNDVATLHDKIVAVLTSAGIAWPKDSETSFHTLSEDDYDEDGVGEDQPRHAGDLPKE